MLALLKSWLSSLSMSAWWSGLGALGLCLYAASRGDYSVALAALATAVSSLHLKNQNQDQQAQLDQLAHRLVSHATAIDQLQRTPQ